MKKQAKTSINPVLQAFVDMMFHEMEARKAARKLLKLTKYKKK